MIETERPLSSSMGQRPTQLFQLSQNTPSGHGGQGANTVREAALQILSLGYSVLPTNQDKTPAISKWKQYQKQAMSLNTAMQVFRNGCSIALICGAVSGNLECIDFDKPDLYQPFLEILEGIYPELVACLVKRQTPSGGYHIIYRCKEAVSGNRKLAISVDGRETWIETRGEGGYFLTSPSSGYEILEHSLKETPEITHEEKEILHALARSFTEKAEPKNHKYSSLATGERPGDDYNRNADERIWRNLLEPEGWKFTGRVTSGGEHLTRPGKSSGTSATLKNGCLYVFSSNAGLPLGPHDAFGVYAHFRHNGNFSAAAKKLGGRQDYGIDNGCAEKGPEDWLEPLPLTTRIEPELYPLDALPGVVREAVEEVLSFSKAPVPLVVSSAIAAIAVAVQTHVDVKRAEKLTGPVSLFLLTIADSGERKSTCDKFFTTAIQNYQQEQAELAKPELKDHKAALDAWNAKRSGLMEKIKQLAKKGESTVNIESILQEHDKPEPLRIPKLLRGDETPENLAWSLAREWPSGGVLSSEAGVVFGAHGMGRDSIMRNLALLNILWDGGELSIGRRTSESFTVRGARLSMALQIQGATLQSFFDRSGVLARGTGFLARFLFAWPESTQGFRPFTEAPENWPALTAFNQRIADILNTPAQLDEEGMLTPLLLSMTSKAHLAWVGFHNTIESELKKGGELYDVRDVASKVADNAARISALFHVFDDGMGGEIHSHSLLSACRIAAWHLSEARRFFKEFAITDEQNNGCLLNDWLLDYCRREGTSTIPCRTVQQFGPNSVRKKDRLGEALQELEIRYRLQTLTVGRRKIIQINPKLLREED